MGSVIAYPNEVKEQILGVRHETLLAYGAVSQQVALEMAHGVRKLLHTDIALVETGIVGPTGATPNKPVGLAYVALTSKVFEEFEQYSSPGDRLTNKTQFAQTALGLLYRYLKSL